MSERKVSGKEIEMDEREIEREIERDEGQYLGGGTYGKVTVGSVNGKLMAIKSIVENGTWVEVDIMTNYKHPNIMESILLPSRDERIREGEPYLMRYAMDIAMDPNITNGDEFVDMMKQTSQGLQFLHSRGVLHGDIKPGNFLVRNGVYKYIDFGLAMIVTPEKLKKGFAIPNLKCSPVFAPPEAEVLMIGKTYQDPWKAFVSDKTDVFALAMSWIFKMGNILESYNFRAKELYEMYLFEHGKDSKVLSFNDAKSSYATLYYYYHMMKLSTHEKRMNFVQKETAELNLPPRIIELIADMLNWNWQERPSMDEVLERLKIKPVPGTLSVYLPEQIRPFDMKLALTILIDAKQYQKGDIIDIFRLMDICQRSNATQRSSFIVASEYSANYDDQSFINIKGQKLYLGTITTQEIEDLFFELRGSLGSCNLLYRLANSVEALVYLSKYDLNGADIYQLKKYIDTNFTPGSKEITLEEFLKLL